MNLPVGTLEVDHVTKTFRLYEEQYRTLKERALHLGRIPFREFDAVHDVHFEVRPGQMVGLLGHNGSGKSTLLKCIAGTMQPTAGSIRLNGRMAALLELGAGFHPELTGRENLYLAGSIMGHSKHYISAIFDEIVAFAELEQFIDNQVKHYSSGMFARLGFALAVNVEPEILLIDEILAVGDEAFQQKCLDRFRTFREQGVTMLLVTHDTDLAATICDELVVLDRGHMIAHGDPVDAAATYRTMLFQGDSLHAPSPGVAIDGLVFDGVSIESPDDSTGTIRPGDRTALIIDVSIAEPIEDLVIAYAVRDQSRSLVNSSNSSLLGVDLNGLRGAVRVTFDFGDIRLLDGIYEIDVGAHSLDGLRQFAQLDSAAQLRVFGATKGAGVADLSVSCSLQNN